MVLDALPVTAVGKPYKLPLRADATRRADLEPCPRRGSTRMRRGATTAVEDGIRCDWPPSTV